MTTETLRLLRDVLATVTLSAGAPDFPTQAAAIVRAFAELDEELARAALREDSP